MGTARNLASGARRRDRCPGRVLVLALAILPFLAVAAPGAEDGWYHKVVRGDTLYRLAGEYYGDPNRWVEIQRANPTLRTQAMREGTVIFIPRDGGSTGVQMLRPASARSPSPSGNESAPSAIVRWIRNGPLSGSGNQTFAAGLAMYALPILLFAIVIQTLAIWWGGRLCRIKELTFRSALKASVVTGVAYGVFAVFVILFGVAFAVVAAPPNARPLADLQARLTDLLRRPGIGVALLSLIPVTYAAIGFRTVQRTSGTSAGRAAFIAAASMLAPALALAILLRPYIIP
ncbi:MAG: LysM peptidoglycan-binding domain-containing protein [Planctomycetes bacterium]|nr:LysM peptidoglycan-binding domain-containing protein [Planctomycetota bacterium]